MSVHEGKKIVSALESFNANRIIQTDVTSLLTIALKSGGIMSRHVQKLYQALEREVEALPANFGVVRPSGLKGEAFIMYGHMVVNRDCDGQLLYDQYTPNLVSYSIARHAFKRDRALLPISFNSQHTAFRFIQRTSNVLDYQSDGFFMSLTYATAMMQAMGRAGTPEKPVPMYIPHDDGLFIGYAEAMPPETFRRHYDLAGRRGKRVNIQHLVADERIQPYLPTARTIVKTFISKDDMSPNKYELWCKLDDLFQSAKNEQAIQNAFKCQAIGNFDITPAQIKELESFYNEVRDCMESPEWTRLSRNAHKDGHLPEFSYKDRMMNGFNGPMI